MEVGNLYAFVLALVFVGLILGVGVLILGAFGDSLTTTAANNQSNAIYALNNVTGALAPIASTWLGLIVTVGVLAIILTLVIRSFAMRGR